MRAESGRVMRAGYRSVVGAAMVLLIAGLAVLTGCGGSSDKEAGRS
jgi:hypothetical protein